jgi:DNA-binding HxlR family transcriptional regulator
MAVRPANRASARTRRRPGIPPKRVGGIFPALVNRKRPVIGLGAFIGVAEAFGRHVDSDFVELADFRAGRRAAAHPDATIQQAARRVTRADLRRLKQALAAFGSVHRLRILTGLLEGPATYRWLQRRTSLKAGPLYHHVNELRLAGLVGPRERDTYVLTRAGRNALLVVLSLESLLKDANPRPSPAA